MCSPNWNLPWSHTQETKAGDFPSESGMGDMLEIMKMDMMSQMQQCHDQRESEREQ